VHDPRQFRRYKTEEILEVVCPSCGAAAHCWCDRSADRLTGAGRRLRAQGTPPSHTERMWLRQGHDPVEFPALRAGLKPGEYQAKGGSIEVPCPRRPDQDQECVCIVLRRRTCPYL
jgi:hypothetical protein